MLTEYTIAARDISGLSTHEVKFLSKNKHTGAEIIIANKL